MLDKGAQRRLVCPLLLMSCLRSWQLSVIWNDCTLQTFVGTPLHKVIYFKWLLACEYVVENDRLYQCTVMESTWEVDRTLDDYGSPFMFSQRLVPQLCGGAALVFYFVTVHLFDLTCLLYFCISVEIRPSCLLLYVTIICQVESDHPEYSSTFKSTQQSVVVEFSSLQVKLHQEALLNIIDLSTKLLPPRCCY